MARKKSNVKKLQDISSNDPMGQLLAKQKSIVSGLKAGQKVEGKVVAINPKSLVLDIGAKAEGIVHDREFEQASSFIKNLKVGDNVTLNVLIPETNLGQVILSLKEVSQEQGWKELEEALKKSTPVEIYVEEGSRGGLQVATFGIEAFVPLSQVGTALSKNPQSAIGKTLLAKVVELSKKEGRIVLSEKAVSDRELIEAQQKIVKSIKKGDKFQGKVTGIVAFGAFVKIEKDGTFLEGLVHLSEISWERVADASSLKVGDEIEVSVINNQGDRLGLSIKQGKEDPWEKTLEGLEVDSKIKGKVLKIGDFGALIEVKPGVEGRIPLNKIPDGVSLQENDLVNVFIENIDKKRRSISLGLVLTAKPVGYK